MKLKREIINHPSRDEPIEVFTTARGVRFSKPKLDAQGNLVLYQVPSKEDYFGLGHVVLRFGDGVVVRVGESPNPEWVDEIRREAK